jgi:hypothetical protein
MSNYTSDGRTLDLTNSHFGSTQIDSNDYELYQNNTFILGDATKEILTNEEVVSLVETGSLPTKEEPKTEGTEYPAEVNVEVKEEPKE